MEAKIAQSSLAAAPITLTGRHIKVLLVDDQRIVGETIRRMLADQAGLEYRFCADPTQAIAVADEFCPTVILQDLIMPGVDGIEMVRAFRAHGPTAATPLIVLSSKEEPTVKAEAFAAGANDYLVKLPDKLEVVARIRYHSAAYISRLERDEAFAVLKAQQQIIAQELADAAAYVRSLLPAPMAAGSAVKSDWRFITSSSLGGDSFGYHWLGEEALAIYLLDVCGHGVGSALLSVSAINTIRNCTLPETDFKAPGEVLAGLNRVFRMEEQNGKYFTIWYGIYNPRTRELRHAGGGHPPAIVVGPDGATSGLASTGVMIGAFPVASFDERTNVLEPGARLFVYSDGCFEVTNSAGEMMTAVQFAGLLARSAAEPDGLDRMVAEVRAWQGRDDFEDDFSLVMFEV